VFSISAVLRHARIAAATAMLVGALTAPLGAAPPSPTNLSATVDGSSVTLTWTAPPAAVTGYRIEVGTAPGLSNAANALTGPATSLSTTGVAAGTYYVRIRAVAADGESGPSSEVAVVVGGRNAAACNTPPSAPGDLTAHVAGSVVTFSWTPSIGCASTTYVLHAGSFPGGSNLGAVNVGNASTFSASGPAGVYYARVVAINAHGAAQSNVATVVIGDAAPPPPAASNPEPSPAPAAPAPAPPAPSSPPAPRTSPAPRRTAPAAPRRTAPAAPRRTPPPPRRSSPPAKTATPAKPTTPAKPAPSAPSRPASSAKTSTLRVMTWNIQHGKNPLAQARFIAAQNPDVVALQEVQTWNEDQPARYERLLEDLTGDDWKRQWAPVIDSAHTEGNVILTRLPVVSSSSHQMHATGDWDALYSNRSAARMTVSVGGVPVHLFSTHLDYYNRTHRTAQVQDLLAWTERFGARRIVAGDFNSWWGEWWIEAMLGDYTDTWRDVTGANTGGATIGDVRFDYLFRARDGSDDVTPVRIRVLGTNLSDHRPVVADYKVSK
jgi:endonuclease/exonuclease/phosphatase family metal-dependent hydrolase